jgi:hypothetical protein
MREDLQKIFEHRDWSRGTEGVSKSGFNASLRSTKRLRAAFPALFADYQIKRFVDAPCGDFFWMQHVDLTGIEYWGLEISKTLNDFNQQFASPTRHFALGDITSDPLPAADLLMVRDCLVHLQFDMARGGGRGYATRLIENTRQYFDKGMGNPAKPITIRAENRPAQGNDDA